MKSFLLLKSSLISTKGMWRNGFKYSRDLGRDFKLTTKTTVTTKIQSELKLGFHLPKKLFYLVQSNPFKNHEKCFLFHCKCFFLFSRYLNFCLEFLFKLDFLRKKASYVILLTDRISLP